MSDIEPLTLDPDIAIVIQRFKDEICELDILMQSVEFYEDKTRSQKCLKRHNFISKMLVMFDKANDVIKEYDEYNTLISTEDLVEVQEDIQKEMIALKDKFLSYHDVLLELLVPMKDDDDADVFIEIRAGAGGSESGLFVKDLVKMYRMYSHKVGWIYEEVSVSECEYGGGYKEIIFEVKGSNVNKYLQYEAGGHRVQRIPSTESQGRTHTSLASVVVLISQEEFQPVSVEWKDVRVETFRSTGPGGQHVNTTDSAVRLYHIPTGIVAQCQDGKSQHKNKEQAMKVLCARINAKLLSEQKTQENALRQEQKGTGDRSDRIRTYNYNQQRVTDHRLQRSWYCFDSIMEGDLGEIIHAVFRHMRSLHK